MRKNRSNEASYICFHFNLLFNSFSSTIFFLMVKQNVVAHFYAQTCKVNSMHKHTSFFRI